MSLLDQINMLPDVNETVLVAINLVLLQHFVKLYYPKACHKTLLVTSTQIMKNLLAVKSFSSDLKL